MSKKIGLLILLILVASIVFRIVFRGILFWGVPFDYTRFTHLIMLGNFWPTPVEIPSFRFLVTLPTALNFRLFGINEYSIIIWPLICYAIEFVFLIEISKIIFPKAHPAIPAMLLAFYPLDIALSSSLFLDVGISALFCVSFYTFLVGLKNNNNFLIFLSGVLIMLGQYFKEYASIFILVPLGVLIYEKIYLEKKKFVRTIVLLFSGALLIFLAEAFISHHFTGQWLYRFNVYKDIIRPELANRVVRGYIDTNAYNLKHYFFIMFFQPTGTGIYFYLFFGGVVLAYLNKNTKAKELWWWFLIIFLFLEFAFLRFHPYVSIEKLPRYLSEVTAPVILLSAYFIDQIFLQSKIKSQKILGIIIIFCVSILNCAGYLNDSINPQFLPGAQAAKYLVNEPDLPIFVANGWMLDEFNFHFKYSKNILTYEERGSTKTFYLIIDKEYLKQLPDPLFWPPDGNPPPELLSPPSTWQKIGSFSDKGYPDQVVVYLVNDESIE